MNIVFRKQGRQIHSDTLIIYIIDKIYFNADELYEDQISI